MDECKPIIRAIRSKLGMIRHETKEKGNTKAQKKAWKKLLNGYHNVYIQCKLARKI